MSEQEARLNGKAPAHPQPASPAGYRAKWSDGFGGFTKREHMATEALKGLLSNHAAVSSAIAAEKTEGFDLSAEQVLAATACSFADRLLEELEK